MDHWFSSIIAAEHHLAPAELRGLLHDGFTVIPGPKADLAKWTEAYDEAVRTADAADVSVGRSTTRVIDFVNGAPVFDALYLFPPLLEACFRIIGQPFKLSSMHARTLRPKSAEQELHLDFAGDDQGWPMVGFIYMIDEFSSVNGATCFVPRSQGDQQLPDDSRRRVSACGRAGSLIIFNGSVWHGHAANLIEKPRRSVQGAFIRRTETAATDFPARMHPVIGNRLSPLARYLLGFEEQPVTGDSRLPVRRQWMQSGPIGAHCINAHPLSDRPHTP